VWGEGGGNFHLRTQVLYYSGFVTYQFQFHVSLTYLMVFRPPPTFQLLHCLSQNISDMTTGRKRFYPPNPPLLYVFVKWNGIPSILHKFICILFYYDIIDSNCILQTQLTLKDRKESFRRKSGICILLQAHLSPEPPLGIHLFRQSACLTCQIRCLTSWVVSYRLFRIPFQQLLLFFL